MAGPHNIVQVYLGWANSIFNEKGIQIASLSELHNGSLLFELLDIICTSHGDLGQDRRELEGKSSIELVIEVFRWMNAFGIKLSASASDVANGNIKVLLDVLWEMMLHLTIHSPDRKPAQRTESIGAKLLMEWCSQMLESVTFDYRKSIAENFHKDVLHKLINKCCSVVCSPSEEHTLNFHSAVTDAECQLGVSSTLLRTTNDAATGYGLLVYVALLRRKVELVATGKRPLLSNAYKQVGVQHATTDSSARQQLKMQQERTQQVLRDLESQLDSFKRLRDDSGVATRSKTSQDLASTAADADKTSDSQLLPTDDTLLTSHTSFDTALQDALSIDLGSLGQGTRNGSNGSHSSRCDEAVAFRKPPKASGAWMQTSREGLNGIELLANDRATMAIDSVENNGYNGSFILANTVSYADSEEASQQDAVAIHGSHGYKVSPAAATNLLASSEVMIQRSRQPRGNASRTSSLSNVEKRQPHREEKLDRSCRESGVSSLGYEATAVTREPRHRRPPLLSSANNNNNSDDEVHEKDQKPVPAASVESSQVQRFEREFKDVDGGRWTLDLLPDADIVVNLDNEMVKKEQRIARAWLDKQERPTYADSDDFLLAWLTSTPDVALPEAFDGGIIDDGLMLALERIGRRNELMLSQLEDSRRREVELLRRLGERDDLVVRLHGSLLRQAGNIGMTADVAYLEEEVEHYRQAVARLHGELAACRFTVAAPLQDENKTLRERLHLQEAQHADAFKAMQQDRMEQEKLIMHLQLETSRQRLPSRRRPGSSGSLGALARVFDHDVTSPKSTNRLQAEHRSVLLDSGDSRLQLEKCQLYSDQVAADNSHGNHDASDPVLQNSAYKSGSGKLRRHSPPSFADDVETMSSYSGGHSPDGLRCDKKMTSGDRLQENDLARLRFELRQLESAYAESVALLEDAREIVARLEVQVAERASVRDSEAGAFRSTIEQLQRERDVAQAREQCEHAYSETMREEVACIRSALDVALPLDDAAIVRAALNLLKTSIDHRVGDALQNGDKAEADRIRSRSETRDSDSFCLEVSLRDSLEKESTVAAAEDRKVADKQEIVRLRRKVRNLEDEVEMLRFERSVSAQLPANLDLERLPLEEAKFSLRHGANSNGASPDTANGTGSENHAPRTVSSSVAFSGRKTTVDAANIEIERLMSKERAMNSEFASKITIMDNLLKAKIEEVGFLQDANLVLVSQRDRYEMQRRQSEEECEALRQLIKRLEARCEQLQDVWQQASPDWQSHQTLDEDAFVRSASGSVANCKEAKGTGTAGTTGTTENMPCLQPSISSDKERKLDTMPVSVLAGRPTLAVPTNNLQPYTHGGKTYDMPSLGVDVLSTCQQPSVGLLAVASGSVCDSEESSTQQGIAHTKDSDGIDFNEAIMHELAALNSVSDANLAACTAGKISSANAMTSTPLIGTSSYNHQASAPHPKVSYLNVSHDSVTGVDNTNSWLVISPGVVDGSSSARSSTTLVGSSKHGKRSNPVVTSRMGGETTHSSDSAAVRRNTGESARKTAKDGSFAATSVGSMPIKAKVHSTSPKRNLARDYSSQKRAGGNVAAAAKRYDDGGPSPSALFPVILEPTRRGRRL